MQVLLRCAFAAALLGSGLATSVARAEQVPAPVPALERVPGKLDPERLAASLAGTYSSSLASAGTASVHVAAPGILVLKTHDFWSVGYFDGDEFGGVERAQGRPIARTPSGAMAWVRMAALPDGRLEVTRWTGPGDGDATREVWSRSENPPPAATPAQDDCGPRPFGAYVYVQELPYAVTRVAPDYPDDARRKGVQGTVLIQVLVSCEGRVVDTKVVRSIPDLDAAAVAAVRRWIFKPALGGTSGGPVSVWVAVPIKFSLN